MAVRRIGENARSEPIRIAMWSGPRNISTALMRSWDSRSDTYVCDEPLYAHYLASEGVDHPGREEVIEQGETNWQRVAERLCGPVPAGKRLFYQKHMAHHLLPEMIGSWLNSLRHAFLIRDPAEMLMSLCKVMERPGVTDTGLPQQVALYRHVKRISPRMPPVVDARDVLERPAAMLRSLCAALDVDYTDDMLSWEAGPRPTDGVWAKYWYANVEASTGFRPYAPPESELPSELADLERECRRYYDELYTNRLT